MIAIVPPISRKLLNPTPPIMTAPNKMKLTTVIEIGHEGYCSTGIFF
jgi:hypothetical protein